MIQVIDYTNILDRKPLTEEEYQRISEMYEDIKKLTIKYNIAIVTSRQSSEFLNKNF